MEHKLVAVASYKVTFELLDFVIFLNANSYKKKSDNMRRLNIGSYMSHSLVYEIAIAVGTFSLPLENNNTLKYNSYSFP